MEKENNFIGIEAVLESLIFASERAAAVARSCCTGPTDEVLLVAEKGGCEANTRFDKDFKTIADVLAQEAAKTVITSRIPDLEKSVRGEECAEIGGVRITLQENVELTAKLLSSVVSSDTAVRMAEAAHREVDVNVTIPQNIPEIDTSDLGIWIDPIDATAEFISGVRGKANAGQGLPCVTVLIGAYLKSTGEPVIGVINQPFYDNGSGRIVWGVSHGGIQLHSENAVNTGSNTILTSSAEKPEVVEIFKKAGWDVISVPGAGHKLLKVALGEAAAYIVTQGTTFRWDTCAPHSILKAKGGQVLSYATLKPVTYNVPENNDNQNYCNSEGIIAFSDDVFEKIKSLIQ